MEIDGGLLYIFVRRGLVINLIVLSCRCKRFLCR